MTYNPIIPCEVSHIKRAMKHIRDFYGEILLQ